MLLTEKSDHQPYPAVNTAFAEGVALSRESAVLLFWYPGTITGEAYQGL